MFELNADVEIHLHTVFLSKPCFVERPVIGRWDNIPRQREPTSFRAHLKSFTAGLRRFLNRHMFRLLHQREAQIAHPGGQGVMTPAVRKLSVCGIGIISVPFQKKVMSDADSTRGYLRHCRDYSILR